MLQSEGSFFGEKCDIFIRTIDKPVLKTVSIKDSKWESVSLQPSENAISKTYIPYVPF